MNLLQNNQYDLVILDYMMPVYTGLEIIEKLRAFETNHTILKS